jgi:hypothetical protein
MYCGQISHIDAQQLWSTCSNNESCRLQHSTLADQTRIKTLERKRKDEDAVEDDEPF